MALERVQLAVGGMGCQHCVQAVKAALAALPSVRDVAVHLEAGQVQVSYNPQEVSLAQIKAAIKEAGYEVE